METIVEAKNLYKTYRQGKVRVEALRGVNFLARPGESVLVVGRSGAGKSTLLHVLGGLDAPTIGSVMFEGEDLYELSDKKKASIRNKRIGFVFQFYYLLAEFTALENVLLPSMIKGTKNKKMALELLGTVGLADRHSHKPNELSGGEAQRVAIARALINEPDLLLCDEPTGNLDSETGSKIFNILLKLTRHSGKTLIVVSHDERLREDFDRVCFIRDGEIGGHTYGLEDIPQRKMGQ